MIKDFFKYGLITAGMIAFVFSNTLTCVYASENTDLVPTAGTTSNIELNQGTSEETISQNNVALADETEIQEADISAYYSDSVFVGDSIMLGFRNYCMKRKDSFLNNIQFLAAGSFSVNNSLWGITEKSVHPVYQGQKRQIWESISMMGAKKVFLFFGMNDLNISGTEGTVEKYKQLIANIKEKSPDVEIHIISMTYTLKDAGKGKLNNDNIREFNTLLQNMTKENGWGYMDMATPLSDQNGDLTAHYCSDGYVHQNGAAYDVWTAVIRNYAKSQLSGIAESYVNTPTPGTEEVTPVVSSPEVLPETSTSASSPIQETSSEVLPSASSPIQETSSETLSSVNSPAQETSSESSSAETNKNVSFLMPELLTSTAANELGFETKPVSPYYNYTIRRLYHEKYENKKIPSNPN